MQKTSRIADFRGRAFGPASELPYRRRTSDRIRVVIAVIIVALVIAHQGHENTSEDSLFQLINGLPNALAPLFEILYRFGALWAVGLVVVAALVAFRWNTARQPRATAMGVSPFPLADRRVLVHPPTRRVRPSFAVTSVPTDLSTPSRPLG